MSRPTIAINMAMSLDGKITSAAREYPRMTSPFDRRTMDRLRAESDAVLVGAGTLRADNPNLHVRTPEMQEYRRSLGKSGGLLKIVVSAGLAVDWSRAFADDPDGGGRLVVTVETAPAAARAAIEQRGIEVWTVGGDRVDLGRLAGRLTERGVERLLVEGGGETNWAFLEADLVDEIYVTVAPTLLGGREAPTIVEGPGLAMAARRRLSLLDVRREGDELYLHYAVLR